MSTTALLQLSNFLGTLPNDLSYLKKVILRPLIQLAVKSIEQNYIENGILQRISIKYNLPQEKIDEWYSVIIKMMRIHLRFPLSSIKANDFKQFLQVSKLENDCIEDLCAVLYGHKRAALIKGVSQQRQLLPTIKLCQWRIDITISSSFLPRILEPVILMEWTLNTGKQYIFELSLSKFHLMRHTIANLLLKVCEIEEINWQKLV